MVPLAMVAAGDGGAVVVHRKFLRLTGDAFEVTAIVQSDLPIATRVSMLIVARHEKVIDVAAKHFLAQVAENDFAAGTLAQPINDCLQAALPAHPGPIGPL